jgi:hypothetical protein
METDLMEISSGVVTTPDGASHQIHGGAYLSPEAYLRTHSELGRLRQQQAEAAASKALPMLLVGASVFGLAIGFWLGTRSVEED